MLALTMPRFGIETTFVNPRDHDGFAKAIKPETRLVLGETIGNPGGEVLDIPAIAAIAHAAKIPLMIDNTFASPVLCRPLTLGADIVFHSATKFIGGHGVAIGGVIVESGRFDWEASGKFPTLTEPYAGYHGIDFAEEFGPHAFIMRARTEGVRDFGCCMAPQNGVLPAAGTGDAAAAHRAAWRERAQGDRLPQDQSRRRAHRLAGAARASRPCAGAEAAAQGRGLDLQLRHQGRARGRPALHRAAEALLASRQRGRRQVAGDPSRLDDACPARCRRRSPRPASARA